MATVFMAEDDPLMVSIYARTFKANGFDLQMAMDGEQAIDSLKAMDQKPDVVILDIMMPKKDGFQVLQEMKQDDLLKHIPVICLTNLSGPENAQKAIGLGANAYMVKSQHGPVEIVDKVKEIYGKMGKQ